MRVSGKWVLLILFSTAIGLCLWVRHTASRLTPIQPPEVELLTPKEKTKPGYRTKMYPTMEQARSIAEKKLVEISNDKKIITQYKSVGDGWVFYYESQKYLNTGKPSDRIEGKPIYIAKDGSAEYYNPNIRQH